MQSVYRAVFYSCDEIFNARAPVVADTGPGLLVSSKNLNTQPAATQRPWEHRSLAVLVYQTQTHCLNMPDTISFDSRLHSYFRNHETSHQNSCTVNANQQMSALSLTNAHYGNYWLNSFARIMTGVCMSSVFTIISE